MYGTETLQRHQQWDLGMSPREELRMQSEIAPALIARRARDHTKKFLLDEIGDAALQKARLRSHSEHAIVIPTSARIFSPGAIDRKVMQRDALVSGTGGYLVGTENISFIELLRNRMVCLQLGVRRLSGLVGNCTIPKQTAGATAYWLATETTAITEGNQTFAQVALTPNTVGAYTQISRLLQLQSSPDAMAIIMQDLAQQVAIAVDLAIISGTGTEQPLGITGTGSIGTVTGTSMDTAKLLEFQSDVAAANALTSTCGYLTTSDVAGLLLARQRFAGPTGDSLWQGNLLDGTILGFRAMSSPQMAAGTMLFGDWSTVYLAEWGVIQLETNPYDNFSQGLTGIRALYSCDVGVTIPQAFSYASSVT